MIQTVFNATTVFLLNDAPNVAKSYQTDFACTFDNQSSLTRRETRRPYTENLLTTVKCSVTIADAALRTLLGQLRQLKAQPVVCPFWPAVSFWSSRAAQQITGGIYVAFKRDWSQFTIYLAGAEPLWPLPNDYVCPLMWGFFSRVVQLPFANASQSTFQLQFEEAGDPSYAIGFTPQSGWPDGPKPAGYATAPKVMPFFPDYRRNLDEFRFDLKRKKFGFTREQDATFYPHDVYRGSQAQYTLSGDGAISDFLAFFANYSGQGASFWTASSLESARLQNSCAAVDVALTMTGVEALQTNDYLCAFHNGQIYFAQVHTIVGNVVTFFAALGVALPAGAQLFALNLVEISGSKLTLDWKSPVLALAKFAWTEVRPETALTFDETIGVTIGQLNRRVLLFDFWRDYGNGTTVHYRFTNFEADVVYGGHTWTHGSFDVDAMSKTLNLEDDSCDLSTSLVDSFGNLFAGNPFVDEISHAGEVPLNCQISFLENGVSTVMYTGTVNHAERDGNSVKAKMTFRSALFATNLPILTRGRFCSHVKGPNPAGTFLISAGCTLLKANFAFTALVVGPVSAAYPFALNLNTLTPPGAAPTYFANWFVPGYATWGAGANYQRRAITASTLPVAGALQINLHNPFKGLPNVGDTITLYPGCDGLVTTCKAYDATNNPTGKFNNFLNFIGNYLAPVTDPSTTGQPTTGIRGGKK